MSNKYLKFNSRSKYGKCLSNFSLLPVVIDDNYFISGEHCFHYYKYLSAYKLVFNERKKKILEYSNKFIGINSEFKNSKQAKKAGGKKGFFLKNEELINWNKESNLLQKKICIYKKKYKEIKECLKIYKDYIFIHQDNFANKNTIWGAKVKNNEIIGKNRLGKIWMNLL